MPMKFTSDTEWMDALTEVCELGQARMKEVALHTHFNTEREITAWTASAMNSLSATGVRVRNQSVLIHGVNDSFDHMRRTTKKLSSLLILAVLPLPARYGTELRTPSHNGASRGKFVTENSGLNRRIQHTARRL